MKFCISWLANSVVSNAKRATRLLQQAFISIIFRYVCIQVTRSNGAVLAYKTIEIV